MSLFARIDQDEWRLLAKRDIGCAVYCVVKCLSSLEAGECTWSVDRIAKELNVAKVSVWRAELSLAKEGLITRESRGSVRVLSIPSTAMKSTAMKSTATQTEGLPPGRRGVYRDVDGSSTAVKTDRLPRCNPENIDQEDLTEDSTTSRARACTREEGNESEAGTGTRLGEAGQGEAVRGTARQEQGEDEGSTKSEEVQGSADMDTAGPGAARREQGMDVAERGVARRGLAWRGAAGPVHGLSMSEDEGGGREQPIPPKQIEDAAGPGSARPGAARQAQGAAWHEQGEDMDAARLGSAWPGTSMARREQGEDVEHQSAADWLTQEWVTRIATPMRLATNLLLDSTAATNLSRAISMGATREDFERGIGALVAMGRDRLQFLRCSTLAQALRPPASDPMGEVKLLRAARGEYSDSAGQVKARPGSARARQGHGHGGDAAQGSANVDEAGLGTVRQGRAGRGVAGQEQGEDMVEGVLLASCEDARVKRLAALVREANASRGDLWCKVARVRIEGDALRLVRQSMLLFLPGDERLSGMAKEAGLKEVRW